MGLTSSTTDRRKSTPPTENEIRQAIDKMFQGGRAASITDYSMGSINFNDAPTEETRIPATPETIPSVANGGYGRPAKYQKYYIDFNKVAQNGGVVSDVESDEYQAISEFSEFERIKKHLLRTMEEERGQMGGQMSEDDLSRLFEQTVSDTSADGQENLKNLRNFLSVLRGGSTRGGGDDDDDEGVSDDVDVDDEEDKPVVVDEDNDSDGDVMAVSDDDEDDEADEADEAGEKKVNAYSETSYNNRSSDINILPFYSTSSASDFSFKHPYVKNRFD